VTEKQKKLLTTALELFAEEGFQATSTNKIAREAGVSEGLIFRHFKNKEGLLTAILEQGQELATAYYAPLLEMTDPKAILNTIISIPFKIKESEHKFWRLIYKLKWQQQKYNSISFEFMLEKAQQAFKELGYPDPKAEVTILEMILDGAATVILLKDKQYDKVKTLNTIKSKYSLGN
jgi:AcrR family transcriptional regulator